METNNQGKYEGYIWWSNQIQPDVIHGKEFDLERLKDDINPFVVEGQLWDSAVGLSVSIRYVDGKHIINCHQITDEDLNGSPMVTPEEYISHIKEVNKLCFLRYWKAEENELCEHFETLRPEKLVFVGFKAKNKED
ncbi:MAG: TIGR04423 family type III CRISPR-associated protein [Muribaculaceae bacterium]|nr:TIGR04423 family type III CRISPR-associated protein [Muribaculaceae bacterium]